MDGWFLKKFSLIASCHALCLTYRFDQPHHVISKFLSYEAKLMFWLFCHQLRQAINN